MKKKGVMIQILMEIIKNIKSNSSRLALFNHSKAFMISILHLSEIFSLTRLASILAANFGVFSMNVTDLAPLESASMPSAPDPEKQSAHLRSSISKFNQLKRISLNLFDVGLSLEEEGKEI